MFDSWAKIPSGIMKGNIWQFGNYKQCLNVNMKLPRPLGTLEGQYCFANLMLNNNDKDLQRDLIDTQDTINRVFDVNEESKALSLGIINGICIPKICKPEDLKFLPFNLTKCTGKKEYPWETLDYVAM